MTDRRGTDDRYVGAAGDVRSSVTQHGKFGYTT
jgi:hypothetical protein